MESWADLAAEFWWFAKEYTDNARLEKAQSDKIRQLSTDYHVLSKYAHQLRSWLHVFICDDIESVTLTTWKTIEDRIHVFAKSLKRGEPYDTNVQNCATLINYFRKNPTDVAALLLSHSVDMHGYDSHRSLVEAVLLSMYSGPFELRELTLFRLMFTDLLQRETADGIQQHYHEDDCDNNADQQPRNSSAAVFFAARDPRPMAVIVLETFLTRFITCVVSSFTESVQELYNGVHQLDPLPARVIAQFRPMDDVNLKKDAHSLDEHKDEDRKSCMMTSAAISSLERSEGAQTVDDIARMSAGSTASFTRNMLGRTSTVRSTHSTLTRSSGSGSTKSSDGAQTAAQMQPISDNDRKPGRTRSALPKQGSKGKLSAFFRRKSTMKDVPKQSKVAVKVPTKGTKAVVSRMSGGGTTRVYRNAISVTQQNLKRTVDQFMVEVYDSFDRWPWQLRVVLKDVLAFCKARWPKTYKPQQARVVMHILYHLLVIPALRKPHLYGLHNEPPPHARVKHNLSIVTLMLRQIIINAEPFTTDSHLKVMNTFVTMHINRVKERVLSFIQGFDQLPSLEASRTMYIEKAEEIVLWPSVSMDYGQVHAIHRTLFDEIDCGKLRIKSDNEKELQGFEAFSFIDQTGFLLVDVRSSVCSSGGDGGDGGGGGVVDETKPVVIPLEKRFEKVWAANGKDDKEVGNLLKLIGTAMLLLHPSLIQGFQSSPTEGNALEMFLYAMNSTSELMNQDWETYSRVFVVFQELVKCLQKVPESVSKDDFAALRATVSKALEDMKDTHSKEWKRRSLRLRQGVSRTTSALTEMKKELTSVDKVVFRLKFRLFCRDEYVPFEITLPRKSGVISHDLGGTLKHPKDKESKDSTIFKTDTIETFISKYLQFQQLFQDDKNLASEVHSVFYKAASAVLLDDNDFATSSPLTNDQPPKENSTNDFLNATLEDYLCRHTYSVFFSEGTAPDSKDDQILFSDLKTLTWVQTRHLTIGHLPNEISYWSRSIDQLKRLDLERSPAAKLRRLVMCVKWIAKLMSVRPGPIDADSSLSALIFVIIHTCPPRLCSNLEYIQLMSQPEKLALGEGSYCLMQFDTARHYISTRLGSHDRESFEKECAEMAAKDASKAKTISSKHTPVRRVSKLALLHSPCRERQRAASVNWNAKLENALLIRVLSFLPEENCNLVCRKWHKIATKNQETEMLRELPTDPKAAMQFLQNLPSSRKASQTGMATGRGSRGSGSSGGTGDKLDSFTEPFIQPETAIAPVRGRGRRNTIDQGRGSTVGIKPT